MYYRGQHTNQIVIRFTLTTLMLHQLHLNAPLLKEVRKRFSNDDHPGKAQYS